MAGVCGSIPSVACVRWHSMPRGYRAVLSPAGCLIPCLPLCLAARVVHDTYRRMMNLPPVVNGSEQSDHSALLPPAGASGGYFGSAAAAAAVADAYAALYPQQHAAPPPPQQQQQVQAGAPASLARSAKRVRCICNLQAERSGMVMCAVSMVMCPALFYQQVSRAGPAFAPLLLRPCCCAW